MPVRECSFAILADSVAEVVGKKNLAYVAIKQAASTDNPARERWASNLFGQISLSNRKQIRSNAMVKAQDERQKRRAEDKRVKEVKGVDWGNLFAQSGS
ncbi:hypothetical protein T8K17_16620 [Thalassobaculum sp. OXR-137]|uniref:hypothetical protein n=1 Tax=Thalassobaculum sp. OXR-137 TaxID=3100173 RepID=UPI002AC9ADDD|nr:hypothetical protein [Thalassobaculum sp. OXR-137]WPZ32859.1 hypothetical protein T8K17_16620 [Thalassobaculum sp. OXR-137]